MIETSQAKSLAICQKRDLEMRLLGIEPETEVRDLFTFECVKCGAVEVPGVLVAPAYAPPKK